MKIEYFHRENNQIETEKVYGDQAIKWLYGSKFGLMISNIISNYAISDFYGLVQASRWSKRKVNAFIRDFNINMNEFKIEQNQTDKEPFSTFNNFFIREFKEGKRNFIQDQNIMPAPCESRYFGWSEITDELKVPVKGKYLSAKDLLVYDQWAETFKDGPLYIARLCPVDYHRFHFPDDGEVVDSYPIRGELHSVNPIALKMKNDIFIENERHVTVLETKNFGKLAYIDVGATCVGKIVQTYEGKKFKRGDEKGYFLFGGSTVIVVGEKGKWTPSEDIISNSKKGIETYIKLGDAVALKL